MNPKINVSTWFSLGTSIAQNGCLRIVPGSHTSVHQHYQLNEEIRRTPLPLDEKSS
ncbi:TPA: hypothetical protein EYN98_04735 [Candidatus Poribacteria bacterium]|jgi:ectoine hydroxylase-related dioxygenase (phytanoyl-CoA dioxygenase family)|nr:hypothetical protein [Candidatus Poribacteria bacterium]HIB89785.1 hypothetical protein [Candidatus Poribacteria bacterium]HIC01354.1 hypothetical protein [Candidatus Poribacteria bacterium]HIM11146.1 hypothetical protein [Candidatus Poribacteria bacterium]HIN27756.1 hypothetical protein [Candidatus Poribacteria bacterium]